MTHIWAVKWGTELEIEKVLDHPNYDWSYNSILYDLSILTMKRELKLTPKFQPVCLPSMKRDYYANKKAITMGWGKTEKEK